MKSASSAATDMRCSIDGLCRIVQEKLHMDPRRSALYLFCGRRCDRIKALVWEGDGFQLLYKRIMVDLVLFLITK
ncbi:MAG: IS66 family insertion sequence element accessory protein TnpB [Lachnospiraceae bacterium]|nr:IS66 family insertion sequence element accessory protein TnpB [Lachnospiraceae bacterium]